MVNKETNINKKSKKLNNKSNKTKTLDISKINN